MNILLTVCLLLIPSAVALAVWRCIVYMDLARAHAQEAEAYCLAVRDQRDRVTVLERELDAIRRELRKVAGKFYAITSPPPIPDDHDEPRAARAEPFCPNFGAAQLEGPTSPAASCECGYCSEMRDRRAAARKADLPRARLLTGGKANGSE
jgi:hypothetical protein